MTKCFVVRDGIAGQRQIEFVVSSRGNWLECCPHAAS